MDASKTSQLINTELIAKLQEKFPSITPRESSDYTAINVSIDELQDLCKRLKTTHRFTMLMDVTAIDWDKDSPRFSVVYHLFAPARAEYIRIVADCSENDIPAAPSMTSIWAAANWHEREAFDMLGVKFHGHPDLRRILMWDDYPYHPLRKDFPLAGIETDLPAKDISESTQAKVKPAPMMGGPFHSEPGNWMSKAEPRAGDESWSEKNLKRKF